MTLVYERPDADIIDGDWRDEAEGQTLFDNLDETATESSLLQPAVLLLHMDGVDGSTTFTDSSASGHTITPGGNAQIDTAQQKFGTASALFDGSGDFLSLDNNADWTFGTGDFTIDFWVRFSDLTNQHFLFDTSGALSVQIRITRAGSSAGTLSSQVLSSNNDSGFVPVTGVWYHLALTRYAGQVYFFVDGVQKNSYTQAGSLAFDASNLPSIGAQFNGSSSLAGWIDEFRIVKNEALWVKSFQPPTSPSTPATRDYIISSPNPSADVCRIRLSDQSGTTPATVRYQYGRRGQIETDLTVRLKQGTTTIQEWYHADIREGLYTATQLLDTSAATLITDYNDLSLEFEAQEVWWL